MLRKLLIVGLTDGRLSVQQDADGQTVTMTHDFAAHKETTNDRLGHATRHEYDGNVSV
jgi:hypothetical protein